MDLLPNWHFPNLDHLLNHLRSSSGFQLPAQLADNSFRLSAAGPDVPGLLHIQLSDDPPFGFACLLVLPDNTDCLQGKFRFKEIRKTDGLINPAKYSTQVLCVGALTDDSRSDSEASEIENNSENSTDGEEDERGGSRKKNL